MADDVAERHPLPEREPVVIDLGEFIDKQPAYWENLPPWARACIALQLYLKGPKEKIPPAINWSTQSIGRHAVCWSEEPNYIFREQDAEQIDKEGREIIVWLVTGKEREFTIYGWKRAKHCIQEPYSVDGYSYHVPIDKLRIPQDRQYEADSPETWKKNLEAGRPTT